MTKNIEAPLRRNVATLINQLYQEVSDYTSDDLFGGSEYDIFINELKQIEIENKIATKEGLCLRLTGTCQMLDRVRNKITNQPWFEFAIYRVFVLSELLKIKRPSVKKFIKVLQKVPVPTTTTEELLCNFIEQSLDANRKIIGRK